jgi:hypothetical protein
VPYTLDIGGIEVRASDEIDRYPRPIAEQLVADRDGAALEQSGQCSLCVNGLGAAGGNRQGQGEKSFFMSEAP